VRVSSYLRTSLTSRSSEGVLYSCLVCAPSNSDLDILSDFELSTSRPPKSFEQCFANHEIASTARIIL
jgi:hypothetical protein